MRNRKFSAGILNKKQTTKSTSKRISFLIKQKLKNTKIKSENILIMQIINTLIVNI